MHNKLSVKNELLTMVMVFILLFSSSYNVFASPKLYAAGDIINSRLNKNKPQEKHKSHAKCHKKRQKTLKLVLKESVKSQIITQEEYDKIIDFIDNKNNQDGKAKSDKKCSLFDELVDNNIITQEKADKIKEKFLSEIKK